MVEGQAEFVLHFTVFVFACEGFVLVLMESWLKTSGVMEA